MKENKEELIKIGQEQIDKAVDLFESKAIDVLNHLTEQFKNDFVEEIDSKLQGYKKDFDRLRLEYYELETENNEFCEHNKKLREENQQLKSNSIGIAIMELNAIHNYLDQPFINKVEVQTAIIDRVKKLKQDFHKYSSFTINEQNKVAECTLIDGYNCSLCGASQADIRKKYSNFCSNCGAKIKANSQSFYGPFYSLPELNENNLIFATEQEARERLEGKK